MGGDTGGITSVPPGNIFRLFRLHDISVDFFPDAIELFTIDFDPLSILPRHLRDSFHSNGRELGSPHSGGWVTCVFRRWSREESGHPDHELLLPMEFSGTARNARSVYAVTLVLEGTVRVLLPDRNPTEARPGDLIRFHANQAIIPIQGQAGALECSLGIEGATAKRLEQCGLIHLEDRIDRRPLATATLLDYYEMFGILCDPRISPPAVLRRTLAFFDGIESPYFDETSAGDWFRRACLLLQIRVEPGFTMREAAAACGVDYRRFRLGFREKTGLPPNAYQLEARMRRARRLLANHSVKETAALLGYDDPFLFSRQFKRFHKVPPSALRGRS